MKAHATSGMDMNGRIAALLRDFAAVQKSKPSMWGYKRAASAILALERPVETLLNPDGTLQKIPNIGPASTRIILEVLHTGSSPTIESAIAASGQQKDVERRRGLRDHFLSRAQVVNALRNRKLTGPRVEDYHGDLQMHSTWSDGSQTLADIVEACINLGYTFCAVTDHSYGLKIAGGLSMAELAEQHQEIDALNKKHRGRFRLLKGIEANIRGDGSIDMEPHELATLEIVVAAPHSVLRSEEDQTARMVAAVSSPGVHILGHPRGRMFGSRPGVAADWDRVFEAATKSNVAIEIDGDPARQDQTTTWRAARSMRVAYSRSTATRTRPASCPVTRRPRSRTPVLPACRPIASSTVGRWNDWWTGRNRNQAETGHDLHNQRLRPVISR